MKDKLCLLISFLFVFMLAYINYFQGYANLNGPNWDEEYHIPAAEKYLAGVAFLDGHPPLGKMIIALGEKLFQPNKELDKTIFLDKSRTRPFPVGFNYSGFRFFPAICSVFSACLFLLIFYQISSKLLLSFLFTLFYIFENSFVVHSRVGSTDSIQVFLILFITAYFIYLFKQKGHISILKYTLLAIGVGLSFSIKLTGLIVLLFFIPLYIRERYRLLVNFGTQSKMVQKKLFLDLGIKVIVVTLTIAFVFFSIFYVHISLGNKNIETQNFKLPGKYIKLIENGEYKYLKNFPYLLSENLNFIVNFNDKVSRRVKYDRNEAGSHPFNWVIGGKVPLYAYNKVQGNVKKLMPVGNPVVWFGCLLSIFLSLVLIFGKIIFGLKVSNNFQFNLLATFLLLYISYMVVMLNIDRVMYLHHYYIPLFFSLIMSFLIFNYIFEKLLVDNDRIVYGSLILLVVQAVICFYYFYPLTYKQEISRYELKQRMWIEAWGIEHAK